MHLLGHRDDVFTLLRECDVFVMASQWEGYPLTLMEAMACGCAIVATAVGGAPDAVRTDIDGLLVEPGHAAQIGRCPRLSRDRPRPPPRAVARLPASVPRCSTSAGQRAVLRRFTSL